MPHHGRSPNPRDRPRLLRPKAPITYPVKRSPYPLPSNVHSLDRHHDTTASRQLSKSMSPSPEKTAEYAPPLFPPPLCGMGFHNCTLSRSQCGWARLNDAFMATSICGTCGVRGHTTETHRHQADAAQGLAIRLKSAPAVSRKSAYMTRYLCSYYLY